MSHFWSDTISLLTLHILTLISPGVDFGLVLRHTLIEGKKYGLIAALGIATGVGIHLLYSLAGLGLYITDHLLLFNCIKVIGGLYLFYLGIQSFRQKAHTEPTIHAKQTKSGLAYSFTSGLFTNLLNPKSLLFFVVIFTTVIDPQTPTALLIFDSSLVILTTFLWFGLVTLFFSNPRIRTLFFHNLPKVNRCIGLFFMALSLKIMFSITL
tara:strand:- start:1384 stop:2013 length:630 start_codon:yes stop_codon:yes gene_type:complete